MRPIFLHSWWRSSSTYFWQKFRRREDFIAYYEPLHEGHAVESQKTLAQFLKSAPRSWDSGHPDIGARRYFDEYRPMYKAGALPVLAGADIYQSFLLDARAKCPSVTKHFQVILGHAAKQGRTPVLGCVRTIGRIAWLKRQFGGCHILILRDPIDLWCAMQRHYFMANNTFFVPMSLLVAAKMAVRTDLSHLFAPLDFIGLVGGSFESECTWMRRITPLIPQVTAYEVFFSAWLICLLRNVGAADDVLDVGSFESPSERSRIVASLKARTGVTFSLNDWNPPAATLETRQAYLAAERRVVGRLSVKDAALLANLRANPPVTHADLPTLRRLPNRGNLKAP